MEAIRRILCAVDLSDASAHAAAQAVALAAWNRACITALHVAEPVFAPFPGLPAVDERVTLEECRCLRDRVAEYFRGAGGVAVDVVVDVGQPAHVILDRADQLLADVIVMATHGARGLERLALGSVTESVLRKARCAVLTVPPVAPAPATRPFSRIVCPIDFSEPSLAACAAAVELARAASAALTLVHVIEWPWHEPPPPAAGDLPRAEAAALAEFRRYVERSATMRLDALCEDMALTVRPSVTVVHGKASVELLRIAAQTAADLIVIGIHGRNVVDLALFGSTTNHVIREAACPVLTLRG